MMTFKYRAIVDNSFIIENGRGNNTHEICLCWICQTFQNSWSWKMIMQGFKWLLFRGLFTINLH